MDRILSGCPERSNGALTVVALALEAGVPRNALTQRHVDLKNAFYAKVKERGQPTDAEARLRKQVVKLKELRQKDKDELERLRADVQGLVRVVNQLTLENRQLHEQLSSPDPVVRVLPLPPSRH
jgi:small-conductance mechanosensitive channel